MSNLADLAFLDAIAQAKLLRTKELESPKFSNCFIDVNFSKLVVYTYIILGCGLSIYKFLHALVKK